MPTTTRCPRCGVGLPADATSCSACVTAGRDVDPSSETRDIGFGPGAERPVPRSSAPDTPRFIPGHVLAGRYRVVAPLGRGGMGEVYRADDLKLGQPVALKFLPRGLEHDPDRLQRLLSEVRTARQVSHANVCRVYDVVEAEGQHCLSMEFVDGEDLASLLRRIGRFPQERALLVARQICAGVAAAHDQGILHRDLKPANVMIDGRGSVKVTDFGLAAMAASIDARDIRAGTPGYMSPEQWSGRAVKARSDVYSLGLVLYELFTGKPAFSDTASRGPRHRDSGGATPARPTSHVTDLDPAVERLILRCLEDDVALRPPTAAALAAALPGGDPLAAALAAGETPSPELVADAGSVGTMTLAPAAACVAACLLGIALLCGPLRFNSVTGLVPLPLAPEVLAFKAGEIARNAGWNDPPADFASGFRYDDDFFLADDAPRNPAAVRPPPVQFWYRQSPGVLAPIDTKAIPGPRGVMTITDDDPPRLTSGMVGVWLDPSGHLLRFQGIPPEMAEETSPPAAAADPDWADLFEAAGLNFDDAEEVPPARVGISDGRRRAWRTVLADSPGSEVTVEASSIGGFLTRFDVLPPWAGGRSLVAPRPRNAATKAATGFAIGLLCTTTATAVFLALRNARSGRGDRVGATRLAAFTCCCAAVVWLLGADHRAAFAELASLFEHAAWALLMAGLTWVFYLAVEPWARKVWPEIMISWSRLIRGRWRDPLVGRDILVGSAAGWVTVVAAAIPDMAARLFGLPLDSPGRFCQLEGLAGIRQSLAGTVAIVPSAIFATSLMLLLLLLLRRVFRTPWRSSAALVAAFLLPASATTADPLLRLPLVALATGVSVLVLVRFGLLARLAMEVVVAASAAHVYTWEPAAWYAGRGWATLAILAAAAILSFLSATAVRLPLQAGDGEPSGD